MVLGRPRVRESRSGLVFVLFSCDSSSAQRQPSVYNGNGWHAMESWDHSLVFLLGMLVHNVLQVIGQLGLEVRMSIGEGGGEAAVAECDAGLGVPGLPAGAACAPAAVGVWEAQPLV